MQSYHRVVFVYCIQTVLFFNAKTQFTLAQAVRKPEPIWINSDINILLFAHYGYCRHQYIDHPTLMHTTDVRYCTRGTANIVSVLKKDKHSFVQTWKSWYKKASYRTEGSCIQILWRKKKCCSKWKHDWFSFNILCNSRKKSETQTQLFMIWCLVTTLHLLNYWIWQGPLISLCNKTCETALEFNSISANTRLVWPVNMT